jgi:hypothetical protein
MYSLPSIDSSLTQGDLIDSCMLLSFSSAISAAPRIWEIQQTNQRVIVLSQACDLANSKTTKVQVAVVHEAEWLVKSGVLKAATVREQVRSHRVYGLYFLPELVHVFRESIVDFRDIHTVSRELLQQLVTDGRRIARLNSPYREHLAQHFAVTFSRIALPEPYETNP